MRIEIDECGLLKVHFSDRIAEITAGPSRADIVDKVGK
jgi:hypothetical protein